MQLLVAVFCVVLVAAAWGAPAENYSNKYDNINIDNILKNDRVVKQYVNCLLDQGPCTPEGREFRKVLPDALATRCAKCNPTQKNIIRKASNHIITNRPNDWNAIKKKYDPMGAHQTAFQAFLNAQ